MDHPYRESPSPAPPKSPGRWRRFLCRIGAHADEWQTHAGQWIALPDGVATRPIPVRTHYNVEGIPQRCSSCGATGTGDLHAAIAEDLAPFCDPDPMLPPMMRYQWG